MEKYGLVKNGDTSKDGYDLCREWEGKLMIALGETKIQYSRRPLRERAELICAMKLADIRQALDWARSHPNGNGVG